MAKFELVMPKLGESIIEATILNWVKEEGDEIDVDEIILEIATDKVDSEIPSPVKGTLKEVMFGKDEVVPIGEVIAIIDTEVAETNGLDHTPEPPESQPEKSFQPEKSVASQTESPAEESSTTEPAHRSIPPVSGDRFYSPLVRKIAVEEGVTLEELDKMPASGMRNRVTKKDILNYLAQKEGQEIVQPDTFTGQPEPISVGSAEPQDEIVEMDRTRKLIAKHMMQSKSTAAHVTSFVEVDVTNIVKWRAKVKDAFYDRHDTKLTYTPIFVEAVTKAIRDFPMINSSVDGDRIIVKKQVNIGMATATPDGNLIVPVIKDANTLNLVGLAKQVNDLAFRARNRELQGQEIQDGTFTVTNVGTFGNVMGTPIINQPQVAILAIGAIRKKPAVVETEYGDLIAVRHMMFLSLSYDHRIIDGFLGGSFLRRVADYMEQFEDDNILA